MNINLGLLCSLIIMMHILNTQGYSEERMQERVNMLKECREKLIKENINPDLCKKIDSNYKVNILLF